jgi:hypothetical protein
MFKGSKVQMVQAVQIPTSLLPRGRGTKEGVERSEAIEWLERLEL